MRGRVATIVGGAVIFLTGLVIFTLVNPILGGLIMLLGLVGVAAA